MLKKRIGLCYFAEGDGQEGGIFSQGGNFGNMDGVGSNNNDTNGFDFEQFKSEYGSAYKDKGFMSALDKPEKMFETINNLESLVGKKSQIPDESADEKTWSEYRDRIGVKSASDYNVSVESIPDELKGFYNEDINNKIKDLFYKAGISPYQAKLLNDGYNNLMTEAHKDLLTQYQEQLTAQQQQDKDFDKLAQDTWGNDRQDVQNIARGLIQEFTPDAFKGHVNQLSNENLIVLASVLKGVSDKYISQDDLQRYKGGAPSQGNDRKDAQEELAKLANMSPFDPNYETQQNKVREMYESLYK